MEWFERQNLYGKNMILSLVLLLCFASLSMAVLWDRFLPLEEVAMQNLLFRIGFCFLVVMLLAERITVRITGPLKDLTRETVARSEKESGVKLHGYSQCEVEQLTIVVNQLFGTLAEVRLERSGILAEVRRKKKMRDRLIGKLIRAQEDERKRISRELHDEIGQALTALMVSMRALADGATDERQRGILMGARDLAATTLNDIRILAVDLRPPVLDDLGLIPAIKKYIARFRQLHQVSVEFSHQGADGLISGYTAMALYRIIQESLTNVIRHSGGDLVTITIEIRDKHIFLNIVDNGVGFLAEIIYERRRENRLGVYGMMERVELLGGTFRIESQPGQGTNIKVIVPNVGGE